MKKLLLGMIAVAILLVTIALAAAVDSEVPITPNPIGPGNPGPSVYLAARYLDIGIDVDGSGSSVNPSNIRNSFYAFTGEKILYYVLVRDDNGAEDIKTVRWIKEGDDQEGPCDVVPVIGEAPGAYFLVDKDEINIAQATNLQYDDQTDRIYRCELTVESNWDDEDPKISVEAEDQIGAKGQTLSENWIFNPPLEVSVSLSSGSKLNFGDVIKDQDVLGVTAPNCVLEPTGGRESLTQRDCLDYRSENLDEPEKKCDISFSTNKIIIKNVGIVDLWPFLAATNFYDSSGLAKCPFSNELHANQFEYRALQGSWDSGWRIMSQYSPNLGCNGPFAWSACRGGCRITDGSPINILGPTQNIEVALKVVWPTPCIGDFDDGKIYAIVRAV